MTLRLLNGSNASHSKTCSGRGNFNNRTYRPLDMRKLILPILGICLSTGIHAQLSLGLLGHWTFSSGSTLDLSGQANHATIMGSVGTTADRDGNAGCAMQFDGTTSNVSVPFSPDFDRAPADAFTISLWYQGGSSEAGDLEWLFSKRTVATGFASADYAVALYDLNRVLGTVGDNGSLWSPVMPPVPDPQWHHVAFIYNNGYQQLWLDNALVVADSTQQNMVNQSTQGITIGEHFTGAMDDIRYYDRAVSALEVDLLFQEDANCATTTGLAELSAATISVAPNPTTDVLTVQLPKANGTLELFDATGRNVLRRSVNNTTTTLQLGHLTNGVYLLRYGNGANAVVTRITKR